jgi:hypothetical protein
LVLTCVLRLIWNYVNPSKILSSSAWETVQL